MNQQLPYSDHSKIQQHIDKLEKHNSRSQHLILHTLHIIERFIAIVTIVILVAALVLEIYQIIIGGMEYLADVSHILHELLTIVVGMEFVRMLVDTTPANILEVLTLPLPAMSSSLMIIPGVTWLVLPVLQVCLPSVVI